MKRSKFAKFRDDIINIDGVMTSKFDDVISPSEMSSLLRNFVDF